MGQKIIIDTDAGVDDAIALMMAFAHPSTEVLAITTVDGNTDVEQVTRNVCLILEQVCPGNIRACPGNIRACPDNFGAGREIPVYKGCDRPLFGTHYRPGSVHGEDGLGGAVSKYPTPHQKSQREHAAIALTQLAREHAGDLTLLALGPLTNLALAIHLDADFARNISRLVVMGGAIQAHGNASPTAEFNIYADPEAAAIVFKAGFPEIWLLSWETTLKYPLSWSEYQALAENDGAHASFFQAITAHTADLLRDIFHSNGFLLPDPLAAAVALEPELVTDAPHVAVQVEYAGQYGRGLTSVDWNGISGAAPNTYVIRELDQRQVLSLLKNAVHD